MEPFATVERYRATHPDDVLGDERLLALLGQATNIICVELDRHDIDYVSPSETFTACLERITITMVHRSAGGAGGEIPFGATQFSQTAGSYTRSASFANPTGDLYLTKAEKLQLGIGRARVCVTTPYQGGPR